MSDADHLPASPERCVTASDFVRQFGLWQERALQQPVFVLRRGRPSLVLTSIELMRRLCAPHERTNGDPIVGPLLDAMREIAIVTDAAGRVVRLNRACRGVFPDLVIGSKLTAMLPEAAARQLDECTERARRHDAPERVAVPMAGRCLAFTVVPLVDGMLHVAGEDGAAGIEANACPARPDAIEDAIDGLGDLAWARIDPDGRVVSSGAALARMTALDRSMLRTTRFVALFGPRSRVAVGDAIEAVIADGRPRRLDVHLHDASGRASAVHLSLAADRASYGVRHVAAVIRVTPPPT